MKRQYLTLLLTLLMSMVTSIASGHDFEVDGIYYNITSETDLTVEVTSGSNKYTGSVTIPTSVTYDGNNYSVTSIGSYAFEDCSGLTSITIPESVTSIGSYAFRYCSGLTSITIPSSVTSIGYCAFSRCSGLTSITIPEGVTSIGDDAFSYCSGLTTIKVMVRDYSTFCNNKVVGQIRRSIQLIDKEGTEIKNYVIPLGVTNIGNSAFYNCTGLTSITIPAGVTSIGRSAFYNCSGLTSITIPEGVTSIGDFTFSGCTGLTSITIPEGMNSIGISAFSGCSGLTSVNISEGVTNIGSSAFYNCRGLTSITIPESVTSIGDDAFRGCSGLTSITIPESVTSIGGYAFYGTTWYNNQPDGMVYAGKIAYNYKGTMPENTHIEITEGTRSIADYAFFRCSGLTSITIPEGVTSIGDYAFKDCSGLTSITISEGMTSIGDYAFYNCSSLTSVKVKVNDYSAFCNNNVVKLIRSSIGKPVQLIDNKDGNEIKDYVIPEGVTSIGNSAFYKCTGLTSITIPESVTSIGSSAFFCCTGLTSITIPEGVTSIGASAFSGCSGLTSITSFMVAPPILTDGIFPEQFKTSGVLYVPAGIRSNYVERGWGAYFLNIEEMEEEETIWISIVDAAHGTTKLKCKAGDTYTFCIQPAEGWQIHSVTYKGVDVTAWLTEDGQFTTPAISASTELNIAYEKIPTGVKAVSSTTPFRVNAYRGTLTVTGAPAGTPIAIYDLSGRLISSTQAVEGTTKVEAETGEKVVIVKVGEQSVKVAK